MFCNTWVAGFRVLLAGVLVADVVIVRGVVFVVFRCLLIVFVVSCFLVLFVFYCCDFGSGGG